MLGLTWDDIDFDTKTITLRRQVVYIIKRGYVFADPKTKSSIRYIVMDDFLSAELKRWKLKQVDNENATGDSYIYIYQADENKMLQQSKGLPFLSGSKMNLVCTRENGNAVSKSRMVYLLKQNGLNAHSFRHTHATTLIESGAKPKAVAGRLGHSNAVITQNLYTHNTRKMQEEVSSIFEKTLQTN